MYPSIACVPAAREWFSATATSISIPAARTRARHLKPAEALLHKYSAHSKAQAETRRLQ